MKIDNKIQELVDLINSKHIKCDVDTMCFGLTGSIYAYHINLYEFYSPTQIDKNYEILRSSFPDIRKEDVRHDTVVRRFKAVLWDGIILIDGCAFETPYKASLYIINTALLGLVECGLRAKFYARVREGAELNEVMGNKQADES